MLLLILTMILLTTIPVNAQEYTYCNIIRLGYGNSDLFYAGVIYDPNATITRIAVGFSPTQDYGNLTIEKIVVVYAYDSPGCRQDGFNLKDVVMKQEYVFERWDYVDNESGIKYVYLQVPIPRLKAGDTFTFAVLLYGYNETHRLYLGVFDDYQVVQPQESDSGGLFGWLGEKLKGIGRAIVKAFEAILPDQLKQFLSGLWQVLNTVADFFYSLITYLPQFGEFFKLLAVLVPVIVVAISIYDPFLVPDFLMWLLDQVRKVVAFIRSLLPI